MDKKRESVDENWNRTDQALWDCVITALRGLKNNDWLTLQEYEKIINLMQALIFKTGVS